ncbi:PREDICTED: putative pentatricopeptide repeat-containing protein At5g08490 [Tarenaya hassleriana]|uniref:putative pentatricopeptide repeat-containing protein At5g08490 n=1 Tax=Tarenaya hassleriana TaxID=28532 RepID=UPI00053C53CB|nr:PREDICTED: putative pentatricopeptide repeat-containing protein At5g08490 [Tarenaya hassleriana]
MEALRQFVYSLRTCSSLRSDHKVLADVVKSCAAMSELGSGRALHGCVAKLGHLACQVVSKSLLNMYAKCGSMDDCQKLFRQMDSVDPVVWNIVLSGFSGSCGHDVETVRFFKAMLFEDEPKPSPVTFATVLPVCARLGDSFSGKSMHSYVIKTGFDRDTLVGNSLVSMYAKCRLVSRDAWTAFDSITDKDVVSWNAIIAGFSENKMISDAFRLFCLMLKESTEPNYATIANILPVCAALGKNIAYQSGRQIHTYVVQRSWLQTDVFVCNALVSFYLRVGHMEDAASMFKRMSSKDLVSWNAVISGFASNCKWFKALQLFQELIHKGNVFPDSVTLVSILPVCAQLRDPLPGKEIHCYVLRRSFLLKDTSVGNALISFYARFGDTSATYWAFSLMSKKDLISWNTILDAFADTLFYSQFTDLLLRFLQAAIPPDYITILSITKFCTSLQRVDKVKEVHCYSVKADLLVNEVEPLVGNSLLDAYAKCGNVDYARKIFRYLSERRNVVTYNSMISGYVNCGNHDGARTLFNEMPTTDLTSWSLMVRVYAESRFPDEAIDLFHQIPARGMRPDTLTIMSILPVCAQMSSLHLVRQCHAYILRGGLGDIRLKGTLLDVYAKCGSLRSASVLFQSDPHKDLVMFTAMIGGYAVHGMGKEALMIYSHMLDLGLKPDHVVVTTVLSACCHAGLIDEGLKIFDSIGMVHRMKPTMEQYACVVNLLARRGRVEDAYSFVTGMPIEPNENIWGTLLGACTTYHNVELGRAVADHLLEAESDNIGNYVLMSNLYAADARWEGVMELRKLMKERDLKKPAGCSWIEVEGKRNVFVAGDCSHPQRNSIFSTLLTLGRQVKESLQLK